MFVLFYYLFVLCLSFYTFTTTNHTPQNQPSLNQSPAIPSQANFITITPPLTHHSQSSTQKKPRKTGPTSSGKTKKFHLHMLRNQNKTSHSTLFSQTFPPGQSKFHCQNQITISPPHLHKNLTNNRHLHLSLRLPPVNSPLHLIQKKEYLPSHLILLQPANYDQLPPKNTL